MKPSLLLHAVRTAQPRQLRARALRPLRRRQLGAGTPPPFRPLEIVQGELAPVEGPLDSALPTGCPAP